MDETIRIRAVEKEEWNSTLKGFQPDNIEQLLAVYSATGEIVGTICASVDGKYYINGQPEVDYTSLQAAAGALLKQPE